MADAGRAVFLSYASQDAEAARRICEALRGAGIEVWLDQDGGLVGGDAWDAKILLGEKEPSISELRAVHDMGYGFGYTLRLNPDWAPLRDEPKFQQLMKEAEARADAQPRPKK